MHERGRAQTVMGNSGKISRRQAGVNEGDLYSTQDFSRPRAEKSTYGTRAYRSTLLPSPPEELSVFLFLTNPRARQWNFQRRA